MAFSKDKGKRFERQVADLLTDLFQVGKFLRTQGSGAYTGGANAHRLNTIGNSTARLLRGDIIPPDNINLIVECKNHADFGSGFSGIMAGDNKKLNQWLQEVYTDSNYNEVPNFLVFKITDNTGRLFFALPEVYFDSEIIRKHTHTQYNIYLSKPDAEGQPSHILHRYYIVTSQVIYYPEVKDYILSIISDNELKEQP